MDYKKFCISFFSLIIVFLVIVYPMAFYMQLGVPTERTRYLNEWWHKKESYASSIETNKILIASGSNTLFSVRAFIIEKQLNIPTINFGVHAGLGLKYILNRVIRSINDGDIVILPLEYEMYQGIENYGGEFGMYVSARDEEYFKEMPILEKIMFIYSTKPEDILYGLKERFRPSKQRIGNYDSKHLNEHGDMLNNRSEKRKSDNELLSVTKDKIFTDSLCPSIDFQDYVSSFLSFCRSKKLKVIVMYPAYCRKNENLIKSDLEKIRAIQSYWESHNVIVLNDLESNLYDVRYFYDGNYHMNNLGAEYRTKQIIKGLESIL